MDREIPRWQCRFENDRRAFGLLSEAIELSTQRPLADLEREGVIQRFEFSWELAWKLMNDLLSADGVDLVVYGDVDPVLEAHLWTLFEDGDLAVEVDVASHALIRHAGLRKHIDETVQALFDADDLRAEMG